MTCFRYWRYILLDCLYLWLWISVSIRIQRPTLPFHAMCVSVVSASVSLLATKHWVENQLMLWCFFHFLVTFVPCGGKQRASSALFLKHHQISKCSVVIQTCKKNTFINKQLIELYLDMKWKFILFQNDSKFERQVWKTGAWNHAMSTSSDQGSPPKKRLKQSSIMEHLTWNTTTSDSGSSKVRNHYPQHHHQVFKKDVSSIPWYVW